MKLHSEMTSMSVKVACPNPLESRSSVMQQVIGSLGTA